MNFKLFISSICCLTIVSFAAEKGTPRQTNSNPTDDFGKSTVQTQLRVNVKDDTREVHFVRDNDDPFVVTKAYNIANADPYALRGYLVSAITAKKINVSPAQVMALKFNDGGGLLIVSAEEYRFHDSTSGDGIDTLVKKLDRKELTQLHKSPTFIYFPKYNMAANLKDMISKVGTHLADSQFVIAPETIMVDAGMNALLISAPAWSWKHIRKLLEIYDIPAPEIRISYRVIEVFAENDDKIGVDFQSWKNNDGVDLFNAGARIRRNWSNFFTGGVSPTNGTNQVSYWNFNPKWNTRYLDFLTSIGKAKTLTSGTLVAQNRRRTTISLDYGFFYMRTDASYTEDQDEFYYTAPNPDINPRQAVVKILPEARAKELMPNLVRGEYDWRLLGNLAGIAKYDTEVGEAIAEQQAIIYSQTSTPEEKAVAYAKLQTLLQEEGLTELLNYSYYTTNPLTGEKLDASLSNSMPAIMHGKIQIPMAKDGFSFKMSLLPVVNSKSATMDFSLATISLLGWNSDGSPRSSSSSTSTVVQIGTKAQEFVIGGLRKSETVRGVSGLPFLKDLPLIGLLFAAESESIKQSQLIVIADVAYEQPQDQMDETTTNNVGKLIEELNQGVDSPVGNMFFQQILIDTDEWK